MKYSLWIAILSLFILPACQPANFSASEAGQNTAETSPPDADQVDDIQVFLDALRLAGAAIEQQSEVEQPFFSVPGKIVTVNGEAVQVFVYPDAAEADSEAAQVAPNGSSIGTTMASWIGPPHFFRAETMVVLYVGQDQTVIELLENVLGPQFAGAESFQGPSLGTEPPSAILQIGEAELESGIGSYCWVDQAVGVGICNDKIGIPTLPEPIQVSGSFTARFINPLTEAPDILILSSMPVDAEDKMSTEIDGLHWWPPVPSDQFEFPLTSPHQIEMLLEPGLYVLTVFVQWQEFGDVSYGFLVNVSPAQ